MQPCSMCQLLEQQRAKLSAALHAWVAVDEESSDKHPCPDLALRAQLRRKARELTEIALAAERPPLQWSRDGHTAGFTARRPGE